MTNEELDKLEAALELTARYRAGADVSSQYGELVDAKKLIEAAARAHLAAQRQAPANIAAALSALNGLSCFVGPDDELGQLYIKTIRAALTNSVPGEVIDGLRKSADNAYCRYIDRLEKKECLGWEQKVKDGKFGKPELDAYCHAHEELGFHRGLHHAIALLSPHLKKDGV